MFGGVLEGLVLEARGLLPHCFWAATEAQAELLELLAAFVCPDTSQCHDRMPLKVSVLMCDTLKTGVADLERTMKPI